MLLFLTLVSGSLFAQSPDKLVSDIRAAAKDNCVTVVYKLDASVNEVGIKDKGTVVAQDDLWCLKGQAVEIYTCADGTWILNIGAKEAMVEPKWSYEDLERFYKTILSTTGNDIKVEVLSRTLSDKRPVSYFIPETGTEWVVTDLR